MDEFEINTSLTKKSFWDAINILITKPHVVNKRLWGCKSLYKNKCTVHMVSLHTNLLSLKLDINHKAEIVCENIVTTLSGSEKDRNNPVQLNFIELLPKNFEENHAFQIVVLDIANDEVRFYDISCSELKQNICPNFPYSFSLSNGRLMLKTYSGNLKSVSWLKDVVLEHIVKWAQESNMDKLKQNICNESLRLVHNDEYYIKYNELKIKYGKELVKIWPECTDPVKFVYEDIAIATYLLLIWDHEDQKTCQHFVDVGCGNGLLVYILTMEGHKGIGIDVRKRKIWDMYPKNVQLEENTFTPSDINNFSHADWIIGNHSDELTPWIPVIAAKSSYHCKFFLLPCCAYNFDGTKYERHDSSKSQYTEYLEYIKSICDDVGFETNFDRLKIPSTKRICLVGSKRSYTDMEHNKYCKHIEELIKTALENNYELNDFKTRDKVERVRNCTQIEKTIIDSIILCVTNYLLEGSENDNAWNNGRETEISHLVKIIPVDMLKRLKSECGGLQTLLKNNHHIFQVINGKVQFRYPKTIDEVRTLLKNKEKNNMKMQVKKCWFYNNHPQGCPLDDNTCSFLHAKA